MTKYCTLDKAKTEIDVTGPSKTYDDDYILAAIEAVSQRIDGLMQPRKQYRLRPYFAPYTETRNMVYYDHQINTPLGTLDLIEYFLELNSVIAGSTTITSEVTPFINGYPPYHELQLIATSNKTWYTMDSGNLRARIPPIAVNAKWGWHDNWMYAWSAGSDLSSGITSSQLTIPVISGSSYKRGHFIKVENEYMEVQSISSNTLTVTRGVNGSVATAHLTGITPYIYNVPEAIQRVTARQAASMYARRGAFESMQFSETGGVVTYPEDLLPELIQTLNAYQG